MFCYFVPDSNNIHAPGVFGEITLYTLLRGWHCICEFVLGMKPSVVRYFGLSRTNNLEALMLLLSHLGRNKKVEVGSLLHIADRRECCTHLSSFASSYTGWQIESSVNLVANAL